MKLITLIMAIVLNANTNAFVINPEYKNGEILCAHIENEFSKRTSVPINYQNPSKGNTSIYSYTKKPFDPNLPSVLYFTGGPGVSSRSSEFDLPNFNVIFLGQRGIS